jgi:hypothetical protein
VRARHQEGAAGDEGRSRDRRKLYLPATFPQESGAGKRLAKNVDKTAGPCGLAIALERSATMTNDSQREFATPLERWLAEAPVKVKDIAARAEMTPEALRNVARGIRGISYEKARLISTATGGVVAIDQIIGTRKAIRARRDQAEARPT